jgi:type IV pilus assembly protein PilF
MFRNIITIALIFVMAALSACQKSDASEKSKVFMRNEEKGTEKNLQVSVDLSENRDHQKAALVNVELGLAYLAQGQIPRAKTKLIHAIALAPKISETHSAMAHFLEMVGEFKDAEREHKKALSFSSAGSVYNNYGAFLCRRARYSEADQAFRAALADKNYARTAEVYENAGLCALKWKEEQKAVDYLSTAIRRDPTRSSALLELSAIQIEQANFQEAKTLLDRYKLVAEPSARSLWLGIMTARALEDKVAVENQAQTLKDLFQDSPEYQLYLKSERPKI